MITSRKGRLILEVLTCKVPGKWRNKKVSHCSFPSSRKDLVRVEATVIEKTESWPRVNMRFQRRKNYKRKRSKLGKAELPRSRPPGVAPSPALCGARGPVGPAGGRGPALALTRGGPGRRGREHQRLLRPHSTSGVPPGNGQAGRGCPVGRCCPERRECPPPPRGTVLEGEGETAPYSPEVGGVQLCSAGHTRIHTCGHAHARWHFSTRGVGQAESQQLT